MKAFSITLVVLFSLFSPVLSQEVNYAYVIARGNAADEGWKSVAEADRLTLFVKPNTAVKLPNGNRRAWTRLIGKGPKNEVSIEDVVQEITSDRRSRFLGELIVRDDLTGKAIQSFPVTDDSFKHIIPNSIQEGLWEYLFR